MHHGGRLEGSHMLTYTINIILSMTPLTILMTVTALMSLDIIALLTINRSR